MTADAELARRLRALERRVTTLEDAEAIRALKARYAALVDARYCEDGPKGEDDLARLAGEIAGLFSEDALWNGGRGLGVSRGRAEIEARFRRPTLRFSRHWFVTPQIVVEGEHAHGTWDLLAAFTAADGKSFWLAGVEQDEYVKRDGAWLHARLELRVGFRASALAIKPT